jgi:hypothetical protein
MQAMYRVHTHRMTMREDERINETGSVDLDIHRAHAIQRADV